MRAFVAVDLPAPSVGGTPLRPDAPHHLTLAFLGDLDEARVPALAEALAARLRRSAPFDVTLGGVGAFPDPRRPRVVWVGFSAGGPELVRLAGEVREVLRALGLPVEERAFVPHLTLFRVRGRSDAERARLLLDRPPAGELGRTRVAEVLLKSSTLAAGGAVHRTIARFPLVGPAAP